jgi:hypothetical protein
MWGLAALIVSVTVGGAGSVTNAVYRVVAGLLVAMAVLTALTGARTRVIWFKVCPVLLCERLAERFTQLVDHPQKRRSSQSEAICGSDGAPSWLANSEQSLVAASGQISVAADIPEP